jgi:hypothetical protein
MFRLFLIPVLGLLLLAGACTKDRILSSADASISTSTDSLYFDTLLTTTQSFTQEIRIYNPNDQKLLISSIELAGGTASPFQINVNGEAGPMVEQVELEAKDSIHVFVRAKLPATDQPQPFILEDSIRIRYNSNQRIVKLSAWGQNAHFIRHGQINGIVQWKNDLPYVLAGPLQIAAGAVLQLDKGVRVYCHADAAILVKGSLQVLGDTAQADRVVFTGDRLDASYKDYPASWPGIYLQSGSNNNQFRYAIIKNAYQGIVIQGPIPASGKNLIMDQCIIDNCWDAGLQAINSAVVMNNSLISNCGKNLQLLYGGDYQFTHCTIAAYSTQYITHQEPAIFISDAITDNGQVYTAPLQAAFVNTICWGESNLVTDELVAVQSGSQPYQVSYTDGIWKLGASMTLVHATNVINGADPQFETVDPGNRNFNFRLTNGSPALDKGQVTALTVDLDGLPRNHGGPDFGAYEKQ